MLPAFLTLLIVVRHIRNIALVFVIPKHLFPIAAFAFAVASCHKPTPIGGEIIPGGNAFTVEQTDTFTLSTFVERDDSVVTSLQNTYLLGSISDPVFGNSTAGIFTQLRLPVTKISGNDNLLDSLVLCLQYAAPAYGVEDAPHDLVAYRVTEDMVLGQSYTSERNFLYDPVEIGRVSGFVPDDSGTLRIHLDRSFGEELIHESAAGTFASDQSFLDYLPGIYIAPDTSKGHSSSMMFIDLLTSSSSLDLHYRKGNDTIIFSLLINTLTATQNFFVQNYAGTTAELALADSLADTTETLLQGMGGLRVRVKLPDLTALGDIAINKAELILTVIDGSDTPNVAPTLVRPRVIAESGGLETTTDEALALLTAAYDLGDDLITEDVNGTTYKRYRINLAKHLYLLNRGELHTDEIILQVIPPSESPARVRIGGTRHPDPEVRMKLNVIFSRIL